MCFKENALPTFPFVIIKIIFSLILTNLFRDICCDDHDTVVMPMLILVNTKEIG